MLEALAELAAAAGLEADLHAHDLAALRAHPDHPGRGGRRATSCWGLTVTLPGSAPGRLALNGHVDVVGPGPRRGATARGRASWPTGACTGGARST